MFFACILMNDFLSVRFFGHYYIIALSICRCLSEKFAAVKKTWANVFSVHFWSEFIGTSDWRNAPTRLGTMQKSTLSFFFIQ